MIYFPKNAIIPAKVCIVGGRLVDGSYSVYFNRKIRTPPNGTIAIVNNILSGSFNISEIFSSSNSFYTSLHMRHVLPSNLELMTYMQSWSLNELIMSGLLEEDGRIREGTEFVAVTYSGHSTVILKDGKIYNAIMEKLK